MLVDLLIAARASALKQREQLAPLRAVVVWCTLLSSVERRLRAANLTSYAALCVNIGMMQRVFLLTALAGSCSVVLGTRACVCVCAFVH